MRVYNLFPLLAGPIERWIDFAERAGAMAFDWIYVNPFHPRGRSGSLYAIADPFAVDPLFAGGDDGAAALRRALDRGHAQGLRWMADLVLNHCAVDAPIVRERPAWFRWRNGDVVRASCFDNGREVVWEDLARFDFEGTSDRAGLLAHLRARLDWLIDAGFDGFRCDAAYQVPPDVWSDVLAHGRRRRPGLVFAAETLGCPIDQTVATARAGFDLVFNSGKWWDFSAPWLPAQYALGREVCGSIGFPESHDTPRLFEESGGNPAAMKQRYLFAALFSTGVVMPIGFEFGFRRPLHVVATRPDDWERPHCDLIDFIRRVNEVKRDHPVFQEDGPMNLPPCQNPRVLVLWKGSARSRQEGVLILNKDVDRPQRCHVPTLRSFFQTAAPIRCVSPENPLDYLPEPFAYELRPGEGIVLVAERRP